MIKLHLRGNRWCVYKAQLLKFGHAMHNAFICQFHTYDAFWVHGYCRLDPCTNRSDFDISVSHNIRADYRFRYLSQTILTRRSCFGRHFQANDLCYAHVCISMVVSKMNPAQLIVTETIKNHTICHPYIRCKIWLPFCSLVISLFTAK